MAGSCTRALCCTRLRPRPTTGPNRPEQKDPRREAKCAVQAAYRRGGSAEPLACPAQDFPCRGHTVGFMPPDVGPLFTGLHHMQLAMPRGEEETARGFFAGVLPSATGW